MLTVILLGVKLNICFCVRVDLVPLVSPFREGLPSIIWLLCLDGMCQIKSSHYLCLPLNLSVLLSAGLVKGAMYVWGEKCLGSFCDFAFSVSLKEISFVMGLRLCTVLLVALS